MDQTFGSGEREEGSAVQVPGSQGRAPTLAGHSLLRRTQPEQRRK